MKIFIKAFCNTNFHVIITNIEIFLRIIIITRNILLYNLIIEIPSLISSNIILKKIEHFVKYFKLLIY